MHTKDSSPIVLSQAKASLQKTYAPNSICYGCGPANPQGFHIESFVEGDQVIAHWQPQSHHNAFPNVLCGGVIGTLLDCHCNWAAAWALLQHNQLDKTPCTVTAEYTIKLLRPTPMNGKLTLIASTKSVTEKKAVVEGKLIANNKVCATCSGIFVAVAEGHPAFHRW